MGKLFGTDGVRGVVNREMTAELALRLGKAICTWLGSGRVLVGRDVRRGGDMLAKALMAGLEASGCTPYYAGMAPTPAIQYAVPRLGYDLGVVITASHNPPEYNGIKVIGALGIEIKRDQEREIEKIFFEERFTYSSLPKEERKEGRVLDVYKKGLLEVVEIPREKARDHLIVVDAANSVGALVTPYVLREVGAKVICLNCDLDPSFPVREPEPTPNTLSLTSTAVKSFNASFAVAHDGDADRGIIVDDKGRFVWGDRSGTLLSLYLADKHPELPRRVFTAVSSSSIVLKALKEKGIEVEWTPVGAINISYALLEKGGLAGFEENGGFLYPPHQLVRDGAMKALLILEMLTRSRKKLSEMLEQLPQAYAVKGKIPREGINIDKLYELLKSSFQGEVVEVDGLKIIGEDYWILVRPSGTEPVIRIMVEHVDERKAHELYNKVVEIAVRAK